MTRRHADPATPRAASILLFVFSGIAVASLVLGYLGFHEYAAYPGATKFSSSPADLVYNDFELFLLQAAPLDHAGPFPWPLEIARFSAPSVALYAVSELAIAVSARRVRHAWLRRSRGHAVVFGGTRAATVVVERLRDRGMKVLTVRPPGPLGAQALDFGADDRWTVVGDPVSPRTLAVAAVRRASVVYACMETGEDNSEIACAVEALRGRRRQPERIHALIDDLELCTALKARRWSMTGEAASHVDFFNRDELAAQMVVRRDQLVFEGRAPHIAVSGTGAFARALLVELARQWPGRSDDDGGAAAAVLDGEAVTAVLVGDDAAAVAARLREQYPVLHDACVIEAWSGTLADLLEQRRRSGAPRLRRLYLCQDDEHEAFTDALTCGSYLNAMDGVVVRLDRMSRMAGMFHGADRTGTLFDALDGRLVLVDVTELGCDPDLIGDDLYDGLSRAIHRRYLGGQLAGGHAWHETAAMERWEDLPAELRRANREQAEDVGRKLASIRCLLTPLRDSVETFVFRPGEIEMLAEAEHVRWFAEREHSGWRHGRVRDEARKLHPSLVPWDLLPEEQREKARQVVQALPGLLTDLGLGIVRVRGRGAALPEVVAAS
jgi:hypothetical protein